MVIHKKVIRRIAGLASKLWKPFERPAIGRGCIGLIDIGSIGGLSTPWAGNEKKISYLLNFEPNDKPIRKGNVCTYNTALWSEEVELPFYIYKGFNATGSSLFEQNYEYVDSHWNELRNQGPLALAETWHDRSQLVRTTRLKCRKLDDVLSSEGIAPRMHFMKIDAQGAEMEILKGGIKFLENHCVGLQLELFQLPLYKGIALKPDVVGFLATFGFALVQEMPSHGTFDSQNDCIFLHKDRGDEGMRKTIREIYSLH
jgi:FkbM family methyltransferase